MDKWLCIFDAATNRGKRCNALNGLQDGEFSFNIHPSQCSWFNVYPNRYMWDGSKIVEWPGWEERRLTISCGPLQIRKALRAAGLHQQVVDYISASDDEVKEGWEYASEFKRLDPWVLAVQVALGKTDEEVDAIFELALTF